METKKPPFIGSCRFTLMILCNLGVFQMMILRFNLSMAIVCMTTSEIDDDNKDNTNSTRSDYNSNFSSSKSYDTTNVCTPNNKSAF